MVSSIPSSPASTRQSLDSAAESLAFSRASTRGDVPLSWSLDRYRGSPAAYTQSVGFNALSTVLNHPNKRPKALRASRYPLPAFPSVDLRLASTSAVDNYLHDIHGEYDTFIENTSQSAPSTSALPETELPSLDDIPSLFFKQDFDLGDPATFEAVTKTIGDSVGLENLESPEDIGINEILHARLEHHANAVDKVLVHELTERAPSLFSALDNLHFLGNYAKEALVKFSELKSTLEQDARSRLQSRYESISGIAARQGLEEALVVINDVESISQALLALHQMTELGHYFDALELVENISKTVVENIRSKDVDSVLKIQSETDFTALDVFASVSSDLEKHTSTILEAISKDLAETLFVDYSNSISESSHSHSGLAKDIEQSVCVLDRAGMLKQSLDSYEDRLLKHILQRFFDMLPESVRSKPLDLSQKLTGNLFASQFAKELRQMQQADYCAYLDKGREQLLAMILSSRSQGQALESISQNEILISKISATTSQIMELVYSEISSIIRLRKDIEAELPLNEYLEFDRLMWRFIRETQVDSATSSSALFVLPAAASNQLQEFLELFHADYTTQSAKLVEMEVWSQAEVSPLVHKVLNLIIKSAVEDTPELLYSSPLVTGDDEKNETRINIEGLKFFTVEALNKVLVLLIDYLRIMIQVPNSATEIMTRIIEVLKQFNSRTCQVVLGAGAMKSAGLKNITAKHLALASQSLSVMVSLIPYIREAVRRQLSSNQTTLLIEFDRLKRDYQEHQYEIHAKLVSILGDRLTAHSKSLAATKFDKAKEEDIKKPNSYAEGLVKETATLHRVLNKYLPEATVQFVFKQVFDAINKRISDYYQRLPVKTELGKEKMLTDAHFLCNRLNALQGIDELGNSLISVAESRQISKTPVSSPRPSTSMDMDATARRSTSIDVQLRSSLERPRMSLSGVSRDTVQQIDEKEEHKEEHQEHQEHKEEPKDANDGQDEAAANADKSLPEVPHEMLQSEDPDVKSTYDGSKADKSVAEEHNAEEVAGSSTDQAVDEQQKDVTPLPAIERLEVSAEATEQPPASNVEEVHVKPASEPVEASKSEQEHQHGQVDGTHETHSEQRSEAQDRRDKGDASEGHAIITSPSAAQVEVDDPTTREPKSSDVDETDVAAVGPDAKKEALPDSAGNSAVKDVSQGLPEEDRPVDSKDVVDTNAGAAHAASTANEAPVDELSVDQPKVDDVAENTNEDGDDDAKMAEHNADVAVESVKQNEKAEDDAARNTSTEKPADEATGGTENPNKGKAANKTKAKNQKKRNKNKKKGFIRQATTGTVLSIAAIVIFAIVAFNAPLIKQLYFIQVTTNIEMFNARIELGTLGYCVYIEDGKSCIEPTLGYTINLEQVGLEDFLQLSQVQEFLDLIPQSVIKWVTYVFVLHFISLGLSFFTVLIGIFSHIRELGRSYWSSLVSILACVVAITTFAFDLAVAVITRNKFKSTDMAKAEIGQSVWLVLAAAVILIISVFMFLTGIAMSRRQHKRRDLFDSEKDKGSHHEHNQNDTYGMGERRKLNKQDRDKPDDSSSVSFSPLPGSYPSDQQPLAANAGRPYEHSHWDDTQSTVNGGQAHEFAQHTQQQHQPQQPQQPQQVQEVQPQMQQNHHHQQQHMDPGRPTSPFEQQMMTQPMLAPYIPQPSISPLPFARSPPPPLSFAVSSPPPIPNSMSPPPMPYARSPPPQGPPGHMFAMPQMPMYYNPAVQASQYSQSTPSEHSTEHSLPNGASYWPNPTGLMPNYGNDGIISRVTSPVNTGQFHMTNNVAQQAAAGALSAYQTNSNDEKKTDEMNNEPLPSAPASSPPIQTNAVPMAARKPKKQQWTAPLIKSPPPPEIYAEPEGDPYRSARAIPRRMDQEDSKEPPPYQ